MFEEDIDEDHVDQNDMSGNGSQSPGDMLSDIDQNRKDLDRFRKKKKGKGKATTGTAEKQAAEKEAARLAEKQAAKAAGKRAALRAGAKLAGEAVLGVATGGVGLLLMIPDLINLLKSKYGKWIGGGCCFCGCLPAILVIGFVALLTMAVLGFGAGDASNACPQGESGQSNPWLPDLSQNVLSKDGDSAPLRFTYKDAANHPDPEDGYSLCYVSAAKKAEEATNVPWEILAAIDYRQFEHGENDDTYNDPQTSLDALTDIGNKVQHANRLRDKRNGKLMLDKDGNTINTITPDINDQGGGNVSAALSILSNYRCRYAEDNDPNLNFPGYDQMSGEQKDQFCFERVQNGKECNTTTGEGCCNPTTGENCHDLPLVQMAWDDDWLTFNIQKEGLLPTNPDVWAIMGKIPQLYIAGKIWDAGVWLKSQFDNYGYGAVTWYKIFMGLPDECFEGGGGGSPGPGNPGECRIENGGSIASVEPFLQCDDRWGNEPTIGESGAGLCSGGCGLTSITMVLNWYGKNVTPLDTINYLNANPPVPYANGWSTSMYPMVAQNYGMIAEVNTLGWSEIETKLKNCEPVIVGVVSGDWAYNDHLVVLTGMDGEGNVFVSDPAPIGGEPQFSVSAQEVSASIDNRIYVHN